MAKGIVAAGHPGTAQAARLILAEGGNAFDAALAALCAACVCEPVLASLGGGGFLLALEGNARPRLYDFFVQTPRRRPRPEDLDFEPVHADFGTTRQEFHIGLGSMAVPGAVAGLFAVHRRHGRLPVKRLVEPALELARQGVAVNRCQGAIFQAVVPIYTRRPETLALYGGTGPAGLVGEGDLLRQTRLADTLEVLALEGERLFYEGEIGQSLVAAGAGGSLTREDLTGYRVEVRRPLELDYHGVRLFTNPPPSCGGILIAFALKLLEGGEPFDWGSRQYLTRLARVMDLTNRARVESRLHDLEHHRQAAVLLDPALLERYRRQVLGHRSFPRGTTHISVVDGQGRAAALTLSNGEGCGWLIPGTGIMMNNMLGEEDINPHGFHRWPLDRRISSMMAPTLALWPDGTRAALGSGGSNRLRTAILQVLLNLVDHRMGLEGAVAAPRLHFENDFLHLEDGFPRPTLEALARDFPDQRVWDSQSFYFGGTHCVRQGPGIEEGAGDPRREGAWYRV